MRPVLILDTNVVLRFLRQDDAVQSPACTDLFSRAEQGEFSLKLDAVCFAELVWVLTSAYQHPRAKIAESLSSLLQHPALIAEKKDCLHQALLHFASTGNDFIDCYLAAQGQETGHTVISYDRDFKKFPGLTWRTPGKM